MKVMKKSLALGAAVLLVASMAGPASAESTESLAPDSPVDVASTDYLGVLSELSGRQGADEIDNIMDSDEPKELLVDSATGKVLSAVRTNEVASPRSLSPLGPGCSSTSLCMRSPNTAIGYTGVGLLYGNWNNINRLQAGDRLSSFMWNGFNNVFGPKTGATLTFPVQVTRIARGTYAG